MLQRRTFKISDVVNNILDMLPSNIWTSSTTTFLDPAIGGGQFVKEIERRLRKAGHSNENIKSRVFGFDSSTLRLRASVGRNKLVGSYEVKDFIDNDTNMKFDVVVGNPPFTKGDTLLYTRFYKLSLEIADIVAFIMPYDIASKQVRLREHNTLVKTHTFFTSENVVSNFKIGLVDVRYVLSSKNIINEVEDEKDPLDSIENLYPTRRRIVGLRGKMPAQFISKIPSENTDTTISSIYRGDKIQYTNVIPAFTKAKAKSWQTDAPYLLLLNENPSRGLFNTAVIENDGRTWGSGIFAIECQSKEEAANLRAFITSPEIVSEVQKMLDAKGTYSFSGVMLSKLPWFK